MADDIARACAIAAHLNEQPHDQSRQDNVQAQSKTHIQRARIWLHYRRAVLDTNGYENDSY